MPNSKRPTKVTRREFLRGAGLVIGGAAIAPMALSEACGGTTSPTNSVPATTSSVPATTSVPASTSASTVATSTIPTVTTSPTVGTSSAATSTTTATKTVLPTTSTTATGTLPSTTPPAGTSATFSSYFWIPPTAQPKLLSVPNCEGRIADDRQYSTDHLWVKQFANNSNIVAIGLTEELVLTLDKPNKLYLPNVGEWHAKDDTIGSVEGYKMSADLLSPVSGQVMAINTYLMNWTPGEMLEGIPGLTDDPYRSGWLFSMQLSKPEELKGLLSAAAFVALLTKGG